jgi:hypothetical protein
MDRVEGRRLDLAVDLPQRVAAGKHMFAAVGADRADGDRHGEVDAAGGPLAALAAGFDVDMVGAVIALDEGVEILGRLGVAEIIPGAGVFVAVDGVVERFHHRFGAGAVVQIRRLGLQRRRARQQGQRAEQGCGERDISHRESPLNRP